MAFNGSGVFQRLYNWVNDAAASIKIRADRMDAEMDGFAQGLSTCITKDGQTTITANLPMSTYRHTGVGAATSRTDYARFDQVQDGKTNWVDAGGTADAITAAYSIPLTTLVDGQLCHVRAGAANATTTPTFSPNGITARTIVKEGGSALVAGDIAGAGHELILRYDLSNTRWELLNPKPATISTEFSDSTFRIQDNADATKEIAFEASGITTGTTRTVTIPDKSGTLAMTSDLASPSTRQYLTSGTAATYTTPAGCSAILVKVWAAGGGGGATITNNGSAGGNSIFNAIEATGGAGGTAGGSGASPRAGGAGGASGTGTATFRMRGNSGSYSPPGISAISVNGGNGGVTALGGNGVGAATGGTVGGAAVANSGSGGGGAVSSGSGNASAGGGGAGEYFELYITSPAATYTYTIGAAGAGGAAGTNAGGDGGSGMIIVEEFY